MYELGRASTAVILVYLLSSTSIIGELDYIPKACYSGTRMANVHCAEEGIEVRTTVNSTRTVLIELIELLCSRAHTHSMEYGV